MLTAILIASLAWAPHPLLKRLFEMPWLRWVGMISYGVYLWHWPVIRLFTNWELDPLLKNGLTFALSFACAALSFYLLERPFLRLKDRFAATTVRPTAALAV